MKEKFDFEYSMKVSFISVKKRGIMSLIFSMLASVLVFLVIIRTTRKNM